MNIVNYYNNRNKILLNHKIGGLGDVFLSRMLVKQIKSQIKNCSLDYACLPLYFDAISDHPLLDNIVDSRDVDVNKYGYEIDISVKLPDIIEREESINCTRSRVEIWADLYNIEKNFDMMLTINKDCKSKIESILPKKNKKLVGFCPISRMAIKSLSIEQQQSILKKILEYNVDIVGIHNKKLQAFENLNIQTLTNLNIKELIALVDYCDYIVSVDTSIFHIAGGLNKPLLGIFTYTDGYLYGKHYKKIIVQKHRLHDPSWTCGPCYAKESCPKSKLQLKPCLTELKDQDFVKGIEKLFNIWPIDN